MPVISDLEIMPKGLSACSFKGRLARYSSKRLHRHPHHEILLIKNGVSLLIDENWRQPLLGTYLALIPAGVAHKSLVIGQDLEYMVLFLRGRVFSPGAEEIEIFSAGELGLALFNKLCSTDGIEISKGFSGECLGLFLKILEMDRKNRARMAKLPEAKDPGNRKITEYIQRNYRKKMSVRELEAAAHYSARHISRKFSKELGMGIFEYLRLHRALMASISLSDRQKKITDIAFDCGYGSLSSFYRDFQTYFGVSPNALRKKAG